MLRLRATLSLFALALAAACGDDAIAPTPRPNTGGGSADTTDHRPPTDTVRTPPVDTTRPPVDSGPRVTLLLALQRIEGAPLPVTVVDRKDGATPRLRLDAYTGSLRLFPDGRYDNGVGFLPQVDGVPQPVRLVRDSGTYRVGTGRITLVSAAGGVQTAELQADSSWVVVQRLVDGATPVRHHYGTARTAPPVMPLSGRWNFAVDGLTDGAVRCELREYLYELTERDGAITGESLATGDTRIQCAIVGRVPPFVTPSYPTGMPVTGRIVGDRVTFEARLDDVAGHEAFSWRIDGRVVGDDTRVYSHVTGTVTVRQREGATMRTYTGSFRMTRLWSPGDAVAP